MTNMERATQKRIEEHEARIKALEAMATAGHIEGLGICNDCKSLTGNKCREFGFEVNLSDHCTFFRAKSATDVLIAGNYLELKED